MALANEANWWARAFCTAQDLPGFFGPMISRKLDPTTRGAYEKEPIHRPHLAPCAKVRKKSIQMTMTRRILSAIFFTALCQAASASNGKGLLAALANCDPVYFHELSSLHENLSAQGIPFAFNGKYIRILAPKAVDIPIVPARSRAPLAINDLIVLGFVDGTAKDDFDDSTQYTWGLWTTASIDDAARVINSYLAPERKAQKIYDDVYVRSERSKPSATLNGWNVAQPLRHGTPPNGTVAKGLVIEGVLSIDSTPVTTMTWVTCNLHGKNIPRDLLAKERPDLLDTQSGR